MFIYISSNISQLKIIETKRTRNKVNYAAKVCQTQSTGSKDTGLCNIGPKKIPVPKIHYYLQETKILSVASLPMQIVRKSCNFGQN